MKQREAVFKAVIAVMGEQDGAYNPTTEQRADIISHVAEGLSNGSVDFSESAQAKYNTPEKVRSYTSGLVSNWLRKDPELNGGVKYTPKNPGSRTGSQDPEIKNLKLLIKSGTLSDEQAKIAQDRIDQRVAQIKAEKNKVEIDMDAIPADLREELGL